MTTTEQQRLTYDSDRLIREWRDRYAGRRTIAWQMLQDAESLVRDAIVREREQEQRQKKTDRELELERRERAVELAELMGEWQVDRLRRELAEAREKIASLSPRQTLMREERETVADGTVVRLLAPTVPSYGDRSEPRPWMLGELEDVIHRLRMGGADETVEVRFKRDAIEACVPFAEFALSPAHHELGRGAAEDLAESAKVTRRYSARMLSLAAVGGLLGSVIAMVVTR